ncbi:MAG: hypothetical protein WCT08_03945 [Patescibacteria group bacterium]|jgi:hypothetical protein
MTIRLRITRRRTPFRRKETERKIKRLKQFSKALHEQARRERRVPAWVIGLTFD